MSPDLEQEMQNVQKIYDLIVGFLVNYSFQLLGAMLVLFVGMVVAKKVAKWVLALCISKNIDITLSNFIANVTKVLLIVMVAIVCLNLIGISVTPFVAAIGALSLGAGLAIQGLLSNYGAGFNIILTRPFSVGDTIQVQGVSGLVKEIKLAYTTLENEDGVVITIPNKHIVGEIIHNSHEYSLVELSVGVAYDSDIEQVIEILTAAISKSGLVANKPAPQIGIDGFGDSSVDLIVRLWANTDKVIATKLAINQVIWDQLQANDVEIPFPQREVQIFQKDSQASAS